MPESQKCAAIPDNRPDQGCLRSSAAFRWLISLYDSSENSRVRNCGDRAPSLNRAVNKRKGVNGETGEFGRLREANGLNLHG